MGRKKKPIWAVVVADSRAPRDGRFIEDLGRYFPLEEPARIDLKGDRVKHWLKVGAQPTDTVRSLLRREGILLGLHLERKGEEPQAIEEAVSAHKKYRNDKLKSATKITVADRRRSAMEAEAKVAEKRESELIEKRKKAAAQAAEEKARREEKAAAEKLEQAQADDQPKVKPSDDPIEEKSTVENSALEVAKDSDSETPEESN